MSLPTNAPVKQKNKSSMSSEKLLSITATMKNDAVVEQIDTSGHERLPVVNVRRRLDKELIIFHDEQMAYIHETRNKANAKAVALFEKISFKMRWAVPTIPQAQRVNTIDFCKHLLGETPTEEYQDIAIFDAWSKNSVGKPAEKITKELESLVYELKNTVLARNDTIEERRTDLVKTTNKMTLKRESSIRWAIENTYGQRNVYWTIWYLSAECLMPELRRFCENESNRIKFLKARDIELGWTALHYAVKNNHMDAMKYLISLDDAPFNDPNRIELIKTPDGRTPLHLAAAYATREIVLELLALGCGTQIKDNVGCYPVDLAIQNKNQDTFIVLSRWNKLVPDDPNDKFIIEKKEEIAEEYLDTPDYVIDKMSTDLRILSRRIEKIKPNKVNFTTNCTCLAPITIPAEGEEIKEVDKETLCPGCNEAIKYINDLFLEMRLCDKAYKMAFKEGFIYDGVKALRRKWVVAKKIFLKQLGLGFKELNLADVDETSAFCDYSRHIFGEHSYDPDATASAERANMRRKETLSSTFGSSFLNINEVNDLRAQGFEVQSHSNSNNLDETKDYMRDKEELDDGTLDGNELQTNSFFASTIASEGSVLLNSSVDFARNNENFASDSNFDIVNNYTKQHSMDGKENENDIECVNTMTAITNNSDVVISQSQGSVISEHKDTLTHPEPEGQVASAEASSTSTATLATTISATQKMRIDSDRFDLENICASIKVPNATISNISNSSKMSASSVAKAAKGSVKFGSAVFDASRSDSFIENSNTATNTMNTSNSNNNTINSNQNRSQTMNTSTNIASQWVPYANELAIKNSSILKMFGMQGMSGEALVDIGLELAEKLLQDCQEGIASVVLEECSNVPVNSINLKVGVFARRAEVLLFTYDYITYFITQKPRQEHHGETETLTPDDVLSMDQGVFDKASGTRSFSNVYNRLSRLSAIGKPREYYDNYDAAAHINLKNIITDSESFDYDFVGKNRDVKLVRRKLLDKGLNVIKEAVIMHEKEYNHDLVEPSTLAPLLEISAMYYERQGNNVAAYHALGRAVVVFQRALGGYHKEAVRVMLDTLRLQIKCSAVEGLKLCTMKATEISRELDKLAKIDEKAADFLSRKCAEMLGLCKLIEQELKKKSANPKIVKKKEGWSGKPHQSIILGLKSQEISQDELNGEHRGIAYLNDYTNYFESIGHGGLAVKISQTDNVFFDNNGVFSSLSLLQYSPLTKLLNK